MNLENSKNENDLSHFVAIIRHGETEDVNDDWPFFANKFDLGLTSRGRSQAKQTGSFLKEFLKF